MIQKYFSILFAIIIHYISPSVGSTFYNGRFKKGSIGLDSAIVYDGQFISADWVKLPVNHFDPSDKRTFQNRYLSNNRFYSNKPDAPIFLMLRGESSLLLSLIAYGAWTEYAKKLGAMLFQLEHRFYGQSMPTDDLSMKSLSLLTIEQALADAAEFILKMNKKFDFLPTQKWIIFGGSYGGALATWMVEKYPHLAFGAVGSSGTEKAVFNFGGYFTEVSKIIGQTSKKCVKIIRKGFDKLQSMLKSKNGRMKLNKILPLDIPLSSATTKMDKENLLAAIASHFTDVVETNMEHLGHDKINIKTICKIMRNNSNGSPVERISMVNNVILRQQNEKVLHYEFMPMIEQMSNISISSPVSIGGDRQWFYQMCTQMGFFQTTIYKPHIFGTFVELKFYIDQCKSIFDSDFNQSNMDKLINKTNIRYGGLSPKNISNVLSVQGTADPWHIVGILKPIPKHIQVILIQGTAHCADLYPSHKTDPPQLIAARKQILQFIKNLLGNSTTLSMSSASSSKTASSSYMLKMKNSSYLKMCRRYSTKCDSILQM